jgi:hypothetical protein
MKFNRKMVVIPFEKYQDLISKAVDEKAGDQSNHASGPSGGMFQNSNFPDAAGDKIGQNQDKADGNCSSTLEIIEEDASLPEFPDEFYQDFVKQNNKCTSSGKSKKNKLCPLKPQKMKPPLKHFKGKRSVEEKSENWIYLH